MNERDLEFTKQIANTKKIAEDWHPEVVHVMMLARIALELHEMNEALSGMRQSLRRIK